MNSKYFDNSATTRLLPEVKNFIIKNLDLYHNPNTNYEQGKAVNQIIEKSRSKIASLIKVDRENIIFTKSGTESNNIILRGFIYKNFQNMKHIIIGSVEHTYVLEIFDDCFMRELLKYVKVDYLRVNSNGQYDLEQLEKLVTQDTDLVCLMHVNNETGAINNLEEIRKKIGKKPFFYSDVTQSIGKIPLPTMNIVNAYGFSGHKIGSPKGTGLVVMSEKKVIYPIMSGSSIQENGISVGTQNLYVSACLAISVEHSLDKMEEKYLVFQKLRNLFFECLDKNKVKYRSNVDWEKSIPHVTSVAFEGVRGQSLLQRLNLTSGIMFSLGSACSEKIETKEGILDYMGLSESQKNATVRISFSYDHQPEDISSLADEVSNAWKILKEIHKND